MRNTKPVKTESEKREKTVICNLLCVTQAEATLEMLACLKPNVKNNAVNFFNICLK